jgi:acyl carrier protein phosphodiesterase
MYLSCNDPDLMAGNYVADFVTNAQINTFPEPVKKGVLLHRAIDSFTDNHPAIQSCNARLRPTQKKYAPVVTDIMMDYMLSIHWDRFHPQSLNDFVGNIYTALENYLPVYPEKVRILLPRMIQDDFLLSCSNEIRLERTLLFLSQRAGFENNIHLSLLDLRSDFDAYREDFMTFFPDVIDMVHSHCNF